MQSPLRALSEWSLSYPIVESPDQGLINGTWLLGDPPQYVMQWVNPIFSPLIHDDLSIVLSHLQKQGCITPNLIPTASGSSYWKEEHGCWRIWSFIEGSTIHAISSLHIAKEAGTLVGKFHKALQNLTHDFIAPQRDIHNTPQRMLDLEHALAKAPGHHLEKEAVTLGEAILKAWNDWDGTMDQPKRICHGDLKISNLRFDASGQHGVCLIDLDTIGPNPLSVELGDAWRSWCNKSGEDKPESAHFEIDIFDASARAWVQEAPDLLDIEKNSLVGGIERICLELSARFCADAINNSYFKENREKYPELGRHNLIRAQSQFNLARSARAQRSTCEHIIQTAFQERR